MFNPFLHPICFASLHRTSPSTWIGHTPFAMFLTDILRPNTIIELGTYYGTSYCAFCQAVEQLGLNTKCYAIDTWQGDSQSGFFGNEVLEDLKKHHDRLYGKFSRLIQSTFDEAIVHFEDNSIDLLHIDGFHTYEEVKKDFEKWLPKTSERGVVLFHDINVREKDFGVWQFWEEAKSNYPNFEFVHSHGLGILAVGKQCSQSVLDFLSFANNNIAKIQDFFYQLGMRFETTLAVNDLHQAIKSQADILNAYHNREQELRSREEQVNSIEVKTDQLTVKEQELQLKEQDLQNKEEKFNALFQLEQELQDKNDELQLKEQQINDEKNNLQLKTIETEKVLFELQNERNSIKKQRKRLKTESQQLFAKRLDLQKILSIVDNEDFEGDKLVKSLETRFSKLDDSTQNKALKFVIGIVTYNNSQEQINQLLKSIELAIDNVQEMNVRFELFIIDNGQGTSWIDSKLNIAKFDSCGNIGFGKGMNHLMTTAFADPQTQWFLCLNPDGDLHYKALNELIKSARLNSQSLIEARQFPEEHLKEYDAKTLETSWASGACLLISRQIFESIGGFDPNFFMYLEDVDFSWRARAAGFSVKIVPKALFGHSILDREFNENADKYMLLSGRYLAAKWKNEEFMNWTEKELIQRGYYSSVSDLPKLPQLTAEENINTDISEFNYYFYFSPARW